MAAIQDLLHSHDAAFNKLGQIIGADSSFVVAVAVLIDHFGQSGRMEPQTGGNG